MKITKKEIKDAIISTKITGPQKAKLQTLAKNKDITLSNLIGQLIAIGYKEIKKKDL